MKMKHWAAIVTLTLGTAHTFSAFAQAKPEVLVEQRQSAMTLQGKYLYSLIPMAQGKIPYDAGIVTRNAGFLDALIRMAWDGFDARTAEVKSRTLPEVYSDAAGFKAAQDDMIAEMTKFQATVKKGNEAETKAAITDLNKVCNACHNKYRTRRGGG